MTFKLLKELPFLKKGSIVSDKFATGKKWGVDRGYTYYEGGGNSHNGIRVFDNLEEKFLTRLSKNKHYCGWIKILKN